MNDPDAHFKAWLDGPPGGEWRALDRPPSLPPDVKTPFPASAVTWWGGVPNTDHVLWACVAGDAGARGPYVVVVYCVQLTDGARPRFPTYEEITAALDLACLPGALMTIGTVTGGGLIEPASGCRSLTIVGTGAYVEHTDAARRAQLAAPAPRANGGAHA
jgi:hypothetical protein